MLLINNDDVQSLLKMSDCIRVQEESFLGLEQGHSAHRPRIDMYVPCEREDGYWRWGTMEGSISVPGPYFAIRMKSDVIIWTEDKHSGLEREDKYCVTPGTYCGLIMLFSTRNGEPLAILNDGHLQHMRVGGGAGLGVKYLSRQDSTRVGILGSGGMARSYLDAFCQVREIRHAKVYSPNPDNRKLYAKEMSGLHGIPVVAVDSPEEVVEDIDILATCTSSMVPTLRPEWLQPGMHITNLGPFELSEEIFRRADVVIRQGIAGAEAGKTDTGPRVKSGIGHSPLAYIAGTAEEMRRLPPPRQQSLFRRDFPDFNDLAYSRAEGRTSDEQITLYINGGNQGLQFASVSALVYEAALSGQRGNHIPTEWFLQDIRD
jgi:ornithine cyclodeaminase/alanine dehydrogenase-like protein (mu-crystallin family)